MKKVFVNGAFDVLHSGHLDLLDFAKTLGGHLLVALDSDRRIEYNKGKGRPFNKLSLRKHLMYTLKPVSGVSHFDTDEELVDIIGLYRPDIMVKGSDWRGKRILGEEYCKKVIFYERSNGDSTTDTIQSFIDTKRRVWPLTSTTI